MSAREIEAKCIDHFGVTGSLNEAGFLLQDGTKLRFYDPGVKTHRTDHKYIGECLPIAEKGDPSDPIEYFLHKTGAMRVSYGVGGDYMYFHSGLKWPSKAQARTIGPICREEGCSFDITFPNGVLCEGSGPESSWGDYLRTLDRCKLEEP